MVRRRQAEEEESSSSGGGGNDSDYAHEEEESVAFEDDFQDDDVEEDDDDIERNPRSATPPRRDNSDYKQQNHLNSAAAGSPAPTEPTAVASPQKVIIETKSTTTSGGSRGCGTICGMNKLSCIILVLLLGALAYFIYRWTAIPDLNQQIKNLETQVNRLEGQVDRLSIENDRFSKLNDELNHTVTELNQVSDDLNATAIRLSIINDDLNATNVAFQDRISDLEDQNEEFAALNHELNGTVMELETQVDRFQNAIATLILQNAELSNYTDALENITGSLADITDNQNATILALEVALDSLVGENDRLEALNVGLETIVGFLNETTADIGQSLEQVTDFLAEQITTSRVLVLENLETSSQTKISNWDCDYRDVHREFPWGVDFDVSIPQEEVVTVVNYVDGRILNDLCLDEVDFANYLATTYGDFDTGSLTSNRVVAGVANYVSAALDWYFPDGGSGTSNNEGITNEMWAEAGYQCQDLPDRFEYSAEMMI